jgi:hypothetical protein
LKGKRKKTRNVGGDLILRTWGAAMLRPYTESWRPNAEWLRPYTELLMAFGATAHPSSGQFTLAKRVFRVECAGVGWVG